MPLEYSIDQQTRTLYWAASGDPTHEEWNQLLQEILDVFEEERPLNALFDHSERLLTLPTDMVNRFVDSLKARDIGNPHWAIVAPRDANFGVGMMFAARCSLAGIDCQVFRTREEAQAWLADKT